MGWKGPRGPETLPSPPEPPPLKGAALVKLEHEAFGKCLWHADNCYCKVRYPTMADIERALKERRDR